MENRSSQKLQIDIKLCCWESFDLFCDNLESYLSKCIELYGFLEIVQLLILPTNCLCRTIFIIDLSFGNFIKLSLIWKVIMRIIQQKNRLIHIPKSRLLNIKYQIQQVTPMSQSHSLSMVRIQKRKGKKTNVKIERF